MARSYEKWSLNFGALDVQDFKKAKVVIVPVRYGATLSYKAGSHEGPEEIISASRFIDEMIPDTAGEKVMGFGTRDIFTTNVVVPSCNSAQEATNGVEQAIENEVLCHQKIPMMPALSSRTT